MPSPPTVIELASAPRPEDALSLFQDWPRAVLFHSAAARPGLGRYSFLSADPCSTVDLPVSALHEGFAQQQEAAARTQAVFGPVRDVVRKLQRAAEPGLPPFQGGVAGLISYEAGQLWERLPSPGAEFTPAISLGIYDWVLAWDHQETRAWIIVQDVGEIRSSSAAERASQIRRALLDGPSPGPVPKPAQPPAVQAADPFGRIPGLTSNFQRESYKQAVARVVRYIHAGDIFQANLSQRFSAPAVNAPVALYRQLAAVNPAPFAGYYDGGDFQVISASPERFLRVNGREVETRPIKGTRARRPGVEADLFTRDELRESEKDRAENVMIVDLLRNDLSRVCLAGSISVPQLCVVETYETVQHLVSEVSGKLRPDLDFFDLLAATFPGGSITGAPKIRAMEIISELEQIPRGPYCGSMFYLGFDGQADSNILIRTFTQVGDTLHFAAGGGITAQSDPESEYNETLHKVEGLLRALE